MTKVLTQGFPMPAGAPIIRVIKSQAERELSPLWAITNLIPITFLTVCWDVCGHAEFYKLLFFLSGCKWFRGGASKLGDLSCSVSAWTWSEHYAAALSGSAVKCTGCLLAAAASRRCIYRTHYWAAAVTREHKDVNTHCHHYLYIPSPKATPYLNLNSSLGKELAHTLH